MSEQALTPTTTHDDGDFVRTAIVITLGEGSSHGGSIDVVDQDGKRIALLNIFHRDDEEGLWFAVDVIDKDERFTTRRVLVFDGGVRRDMSTEGTVCAVDMRS